MAFLDDAAGTLLRTNSVEPVRKPAIATQAAVGDPEAVTRAYYVEERGQERRYYDDYRRQSLVLRADSDRISSRREDMPTIRAMLAVAAARGWAEVKVSGSAGFRREASIEAQARGLVVQGYQPSGPERRRRGAAVPSAADRHPLHLQRMTLGVRDHPSPPQTLCTVQRRMMEAHRRGGPCEPRLRQASLPMAASSSPRSRPRSTGKRRS